MARGGLRADLFYRLNVIELRLPPLRHRREDIRLLAEHFLRRLAIEHGRVTRLSPEAIRKLEAYDFPGNVRELENLLERAVALSSTPLIDVADLPTSGSKRDVELAPGFPADGVDLERLVGEFERAWVLRALEQSKGVRKHAATLLGISFRSLRYRLAKLDIDNAEIETTSEDEEPSSP